MKTKKQYFSGSVKHIKNEGELSSDTYKSTFGKQLKMAVQRQQEK